MRRELIELRQQKDGTLLLWVPDLVRPRRGAANIHVLRLSACPILITCSEQEQVRRRVVVWIANEAKDKRQGSVDLSNVREVRMTKRVTELLLNYGERGEQQTLERRGCASELRRHMTPSDGDGDGDRGGVSPSMG